MLILKPLLDDWSVAGAKIPAVTFIAPAGVTTRELAHMLDSLVRVSRRVESNHLVIVTRRKTGYKRALPKTLTPSWKSYHVLRSVHSFLYYLRKPPGRSIFLYYLREPPGRSVSLITLAKRLFNYLGRRLKHGCEQPGIGKTCALPSLNYPTRTL